METTSAFARSFARRPVALSWVCGLGLLAFAFYAAIALLQPILAAFAGAGGLTLLRWARAERPHSEALILIDVVAFAVKTKMASGFESVSRCKEATQIDA